MNLLFVMLFGTIGRDIFASAPLQNKNCCQFKNGVSAIGTVNDQNNYFLKKNMHTHISWYDDELWKQ